MSKYYAVYEGDREIETVANLFGAAKVWDLNRQTRSVYAIAPTGNGGTWKKIEQIANENLRGILRPL